MAGAGKLRVAFWNVMNLFEPRTHPPGPGGKPAARGPQSGDELDSKISQLADCINGFFGGTGPDLLGLSEIHTDRILAEVERRLSDRYVQVWEPAGVPGETGLAVLGRASLTNGLTKVAVQRPAKRQKGRPRCMIVRCELKGVREPILFAINHWKSLYAKGVGVVGAALDREETADWLGNWLSQSYGTTCAVVAGDFNAEPTEKLFNELRLRSSRYFSNALWTNATPAYLYNTSWKFLTEPFAWEESMPAGGIQNDPRPKRTQDGNKYVVWDQLMVSGRALRNGPIKLIEKSVDYHRDLRNSTCKPNGALCPIRWSYSGPGQFEGASDHYPVVTEFEIT